MKRHGQATFFDAEQLAALLRRFPEEGREVRE